MPEIISDLSLDDPLPRRLKEKRCCRVDGGRWMSGSVLICMVGWSYIAVDVIFMSVYVLLSTRNLSTLKASLSAASQGLFHGVCLLAFCPLESLRKRIPNCNHWYFYKIKTVSQFIMVTSYRSWASHWTTFPTRRTVGCTGNCPGMHVKPDLFCVQRRRCLIVVFLDKYWFNK